MLGVMIAWVATYLAHMLGIGKSWLFLVEILLPREHGVTFVKARPARWSVQ